MEVITIDEQKQAPEIGTPEAAVQSCVNLLATVTNIPERKLAYYLDMYYQLRDAYEAARAEERLEAQRNDETLLQALHLPPVYPDPPRTMNTPSAPAEVTDADTGGGDPLPPPDAFSGFEPVEIKVSGPAAQAAAEKRRIRDRLLQMRQNGVSTPQIIKGGNGCITEEQIRLIVDAKPVPIAVYRVLDGVLETLAAAPPEN